MKIVTLTRDMRPARAGDDRVLPDDVAARLIDSGEAKNSRPFPPPDVVPSKPVIEPKRYLTRAERRAARRA